MTRTADGCGSFHLEHRVLIQAKRFLRAGEDFVDLVLFREAIFDRPRMCRGGIILDDLFPCVLTGAFGGFGEKLLGFFERGRPDTHGRIWCDGLDVVKAGEDGAGRVDVHFGDARDAVDEILMRAHGNDRAQRDRVAPSGQRATPHWEGGVVAARRGGRGWGLAVKGKRHEKREGKKEAWHGRKCG